MPEGVKCHAYRTNRLCYALKFFGRPTAIQRMPDLIRKDGFGFIPGRSGFQPLL